MRKPRVDWAKIQVECDLFDLSEYCPEMRQEPALFQRTAEKDLENPDDGDMIE